MADELSHKIARDALGIDWFDTESAARRVAEHAAEYIVAMVAAEREACADLASAINLIVPPETVSQRVGAESIRAQIATAIRALTPDDAQAALEKAKRETRNEALREAEQALRKRYTGVIAYDHAITHGIKEILALMEDTGDV